MKFHKHAYTSIFLLLSTTTIAIAQEPTKTVSEEIEVIRPYKPVLAEAVKLRRSPDLNNIATYRAKFNYNITDRKLALNSDIQKLQAQELAAERAATLVNNYVKGGVGSLATILGEAYVNIGEDQALQAGAFFRHFSQEGKLNKQNENWQQLTAFGRSIGNKVTLNGRANFERHGLFFYGIDELNPSLNPDPERQVYSFFELEGEAINKYTADENALSYAVKANAYLLNDKFSAKENLINLTGYLNKRISKFNLGLAAGVELGSTEDVNTNVANHLLRLNPYIKLQANGVKITAGVNFVQEFGDYSDTRIFPAVTADFTLIPDFLQIFGEVKGDVNRNSLKNFSDENPFLNANIFVQNTVEKLSISGGIKGTGGPGFGYKARFYSKRIVDMPLFVNSFSNFNKFDVIYDFGTMKLLGLEGEISVQVSDNLKWTGKVNLEDYKPAVEQESYYKPQLRLNSNFAYTYNKKLSFNANVVIQGDSDAKTFLTDPITPEGKYPAVPDYANEKLTTVKGFVDLGVGAEYKINNKFGVFLKVNNLLNTDYSRFLYYRSNGINFFGGLSYSF